ncbi:rubrerythrin-like domain-containing protein [Natronobiforma cellulositropha]|nr:rubrerythrin-like domain-containing protein [Natronobiforma cellulositropha]
MIDVEYDPNEEQRYECFDCGTIVRTARPTVCPDCGSEMRNQNIPLE